MTAVLPVGQPPINYSSEGAIAARYICVHPSKGVWFGATFGGAPQNGIVGTGDGAGWCGPGSVMTDPNTGSAYTNTGTLASPVWSKLVEGSGSDGLVARAIPISGFRNTDGSALAASPASGKFGYAITLGTSEAVIGETSNNTTVTDDCLFEFVMPTDYIAGQNFNLTVNASIVTAGSPTYATKTLQAKAYRTANDGTQGSNIGPTPASAITAAGADIVFAITGATLNPGDRVLVELEGILHDTAGVACHIAINSARIS